MKGMTQEDNGRTEGQGTAWCAHEFAEVDFEDERLNHRLITLAEALSEYPLSPINQASKNRGDAKAAYRFFANPKTLSEVILHAHQSHVCDRAKNERTIYLPQDTSFINYTNHIHTSGLGSLAGPGQAKIKNKGLAMHTCLALTEQGLPLGILEQKIWARPLKADHKRRKKLYRIPLEEKETFRWLECMRESVRILREGRTDSPSIVNIADREADMFEYMEDALRLKAHFIVRGDARPRVIVVGDEVWDCSGKFLATTLDALCATKLKGDLWIEVPRCPPQNNNSVETPTRIAEVEIKVARVKIPPTRQLLFIRRQLEKINESRSAQAIRSSLDVNVIWIKEASPPEGVEPLEWFLYTDLPVQTMEEAANIIDAYKLRWKIELLHKILKSGCRVEDCRLSSAERLRKYITLSSIIAWRILWMTFLNRTQPAGPCDSFLTESEWKSLYCRIHQTKTLPITPPTIHQALHWIARLGGFLDRKSDGEPGMVTVWRGWQRLSDIAEDWRIFHAEANTYGE